MVIVVEELLEDESDSDNDIMKNWPPFSCHPSGPVDVVDADKTASLQGLGEAGAQLQSL